LFTGKGLNRRSSLTVNEAAVFFGCFVILAFVLAVSDRPSAAAGPQQDPTPPRTGRAAAAYHGGLVTPPLPKPKFTLTDTSGAPFDFWSETQKYVALLFFGYTHCPDECPLHMANIASSLQQLPPEVRGQIKVVFVTTDPARDSAPELRAWLDNFDKGFIGLTGSEAAITTAQRAALIPPASKTAHNAHNYGVNHASFVLAYTKDNLAHVIYPGGVTPEDWAQDLPLLVKEVWSSG
jgi:protein SCO1